ncbi:hypothetical protein predicted by Glimmer/Critica [Helicobacter pylori B8]|uniref:Uncharacterized protein n=1 Tax=Helicobacter pylori (strain B8) TaxID=693745 RepID=D7FBS5_HELP3|nr:hypothetical protein predicted by Glimmer/Critica [Helicobacter pylori B8]
MFLRILAFYASFFSHFTSFSPTNFTLHTNTTNSLIFSLIKETFLTNMLI